MISRGVLVPFRDEVIPSSRSPSQWPPTSIGCSRSATAPRRAGPACQPFGWLLVITRISEPTEIRVSTEIMEKIFPKFNLNSKKKCFKYTCPFSWWIERIWKIPCWVPRILVMAIYGNDVITFPKTDSPPQACRNPHKGLRKKSWQLP